MHSSLYMIEKELIEHKMITRVPLLILFFGFLLFISLLIPALQGNIQYHTEFNGNFVGMGQDLGNSYTGFIASGAGIISLTLTLLYLPKTLRKEREEGSSMFWRSMPISYLTTLTIKLIVALLLIPIICSTLVIAADVSVWIINMVSDNQLSPLFGHVSMIDVLLNWVSFLSKMLIVAFAIFPFACVALMVSQIVTSPVLVIVVSIYALKWLSVYLFEFYGVSEFINAIITLPLRALSDNPLSGFMNAGNVNLVIYYLIGSVAFVISLALMKTNTGSIKGLFSKQ